MKKMFKFGLWFFALVGVLVSAGAGYIYGTNSELVQQFIAAKDDFREVPVDRRKEVFAELPARLKFEREVREDLGVLPQERQQALYEQLGKSRDDVFESFKKRIAQEAKIAREAKDKEEALKNIKDKLPEVSVKVNITDKTPPPKPDVLAPVRASMKDVNLALDGYFKAKETNIPTAVKSGAINVLKALDRLGDKIVEVRKKPLDSSDKSDLDEICRDARVKFKTAKENPGLMDDQTAKPLLAGIGPKLSSEG